MGTRSTTNSASAVRSKAANQAGRAGTRRRYDSQVRRAQTDETRERILAAGSELAHRASRWDFNDLSARSIAAQAGISERTVYRHFPTERQLHEALMRRLEQEAGISYEQLNIDNLPTVASRL